jgi:cytosine/adenosine deaminase-related metal-dependent hydrolase
MRGQNGRVSRGIALTLRVGAASSAALLTCACSSSSGSGPGGEVDASTSDVAESDAAPPIEGAAPLDAAMPSDGAPPRDGSSAADAMADGGADAPDGAVDGALDAALDSPGSGGPLCTVTNVGTSGTLLSGTLLLPSGSAPGELLIDDTGLIACAAASCTSATGYGAATRIACPNGVISPSLVNAHDHTEFATRAPETLPTTRFAHRNQWRVATDAGLALAHVSSTIDAATIGAQELRFVLGGATSVIGSGGVAGLMRNLADRANPTFLEGLTGAAVFFDTFPLGDTNGTMLASGCAYPQIQMASVAFAGGTYAPHIAEGINLEAENELTCTTPMSNDLVTSQTSVIQGVGMSAKDVDVVAAAGARLIWSPRSNLALYGDTAPVTVYKALGVPIALGSDWLASGSMNMLRELACADAMNQSYFDHAFSDAELFAMATQNAAAAAGFGTQLGTLDVGKLADVTVFDGTTRTAYRAVIAASVEDVHLVLRGGKALYGDADVVAALDGTCTALDVCGQTRSVCVDVPSVTLAQIQAAAEATYPLFFCRGTPPSNEPTCVPYRDTYPNGITALDRDGDGVPDTSDDCPTIFNPPRPLDNGDAASLVKQADVDGDGVGDACDAKPLDPAMH